MPTTSPYQPTPFVKLSHPEWSKNAVIYQINTRQFTPEGTFRAAEAHLPRLKALGVDILWLMPIHEIGVKNRKGTLGSPYAVKDYYSVNHEFGTLDDLRHFIQAAHRLGLYVILDWVANHTAWDSNLASEHPEWYARDWKGELHPTPWCDWEDVIDLDYSHAGLREYMTGALKYWVKEVGVDGYRCDVAGFLPTEFWDNARAELDAIKPVFMLAEWENRDLHARAFDMTYAWSWYDTLVKICKGKANAYALHIYYAWNEKTFPQDGMRMLFVTNHDKNSWDGTEFEQFGGGVEAAIVFSAVSEGMLMMYNGQEAGLNRRLEFFEKDTIEWAEHPHGTLYKKLIALKKANTALWNAHWGARMIHVPTGNDAALFSFVRQDEHSKVFAVFNFSPAEQHVTFRHSLHHGAYTDAFNGQRVEFGPDTHISLPPWGYGIYVK